MFVTLCGVLAILFGLIHFGQRLILFPKPNRSGIDTLPTVPLGAERLWIAHSSGRTESWLFVERGDVRRPLVLFFHGNAELIDDAMDKVDGYRRLGYAVALMEYRGYGRSDGSPSEEHIVADALALVQRLETDPDLDLDRMVYHGRSLGGGVATSLARIYPPARLVLESTFTSIIDMARGMGVPAWLVRDPFNTREFLVQSDPSVLILHGVKDSIVPVEHAHQLAQAGTRVKLVLLDCGHNDCPPNDSDYWSVIGAFLSGGAHDGPV
ncbi:MAG: alpha/beta hydrolase [Myxococcota bacterium]|nr:alpha/beta hydrolase [Myxococcota bacterium]